LGDDPVLPFGFFWWPSGENSRKNFRWVSLLDLETQPETKVVHETLPTKVLDDTVDGSEISRPTTVGMYKNLKK